MTVNTQLNLVTTDLNIHGLTAGLGASSVATNTAFGVSALAVNTTGADNVALGYQSLKLNTQGSRNVSIGSTSMAANLTGDDSVYIGYQSGLVNTAGRNTVVAFAGMSLSATGAGTKNSVFGANGLRPNTGTDNACFGPGTSAMSTASYVSSFSSANISLITGTGQTTLGNTCLSSNLTGSYNTGIGYNQGFGGTSTFIGGSYNTFMGQIGGTNSNSSNTGVICLSIYEAMALVSTGSTSGTNGAGISIGEQDNTGPAVGGLGFRGDSTPYISAGTGSVTPSANGSGYWRVGVNNTKTVSSMYKILLYPDT